MIANAAITFTISVFVLVILLVLVGKERRTKQRFFAATFRGYLDRKVEVISDWLTKRYDHFVKYVVQLHWYYSIHSLLRTLLRLIVAFYTYFENIFENNRKKAKQLRIEKKQLKEKNHLQHMAEHKEDTSLTLAQKKKLSQKELEGKH